MILRSRYLAFSRTVNNRPIVLPVVGVVILLSLFAGYQTSARWLGLILAVYGAFILLERLQLGLIALVIATFIVPFAIGTNSMTSINVTILLAAFLLGLWILRVAQMRLGFRIFRTWIPLFAFVGVSIVSFIGGNLPWSYFAGRAGVSAQVGGLAIIVLSVGMYCLVGSQVGTLKWLKSISWVFLGMGWLLVASRLLRGVFDVRGLFVGYSDGSLFWVWLMALAFGQLVFNSRLRGRGRWFLATLLAAALYVAWFQNRNWASGWLPMLVTLGVIVYLRSWRLGVLLTLAAILLVMIAKPSLVAELISQDRYSIDTRLPAWTIVLQIPVITPTLRQRWKVRCTELSSGNSLGSWFHWHPLRRRKMIASSAARWSIRLRPSRLGGSNSASTGVISTHNSSGTRQMVGNGSRCRAFEGMLPALSLKCDRLPPLTRQF